MWQGFVTESKKYMNHPDYWPEWNCADYEPNGWTMGDKRIAALKFWLKFPKAWIKFQWLTVRDYIKTRLYVNKNWMSIMRYMSFGIYRKP